MFILILKFIISRCWNRGSKFCLVAVLSSADSNLPDFDFFSEYFLVVVVALVLVFFACRL